MFNNKLLIFDLDNTIYQTHKYGVYSQLSDNIYNYLSDTLKISYKQSIKLSEHYQNVYGTTVLGLIKEHDKDPNEFLPKVYDVNFQNVEKDKKLGSLLSKLPNKKIVFTNATNNYACQLLKGMGIKDYFYDIFDVYKSKFTSKPNKVAFDYFSAFYNIKFSEAIFFDDREKNLETAFNVGSLTILCNDNAWRMNHNCQHVCKKDIYHALEYMIALL